MKKKKKYYIPLQIGVATAFIFLVLATSISLSLFISASVQKNMREDLQKQLHNVVSVGSLLIPGDYLDLLVEEPLVNSPAYLDVKNKLQAVRDSSLDVRHVYTMRLSEAQEFFFIVDAEDDPELISQLGSQYTSPTELMKEIFANPSGSYIESSFDTDEWGTWLSGYAPIFNSRGELSGIIGADISAQKVVEYERRMLAIIFLTGIGVSIIVCFAGIQLSNKITKPLKLLEEDLGRIRNFELEKTLHLPTIFKEVRNFHSSVENMKNGLRSFKKYVPATLVRQLITLQKEAVLAMEHKELTVLFTDIADFATISEKMSLEKLNNSMGAYLTSLTQIIHQQQGTLDKYIGDSIMAFWGAPVNMENHALLACEAALECQMFLQDFNEEMVAKGEDGFVTRIGIHTGQMLVGNMGAEDRINYTVMGDPVNVASRLEGLNKHYGTKILISENTFASVKEDMLARQVDKVIVKGKTTGLVIYELIGRKGEASVETLTFVETFNRGMEHYFKQEWSLALEQFQKCLPPTKEDDPVMASMIERCQGFAEVAPDQDWSGSTSHYFK